MAEKAKIRSREKVRNIKSINKASVFSQRLKTSAARSRKNANKVGETKQNTPNDYAEEKLRETGGKTIAVSETALRKTAFINRKRVQKKQEEIKAEEAIRASGSSRPAKAKGAFRKLREKTGKVARSAIEEGKVLVSALVAGGSSLCIIIVIICLIALLAGSCFGIFFSGEDTGNGQSMQTAIREINDEYNEKIEDAQSHGNYDRFELVNGNPNWPEVLAVYAVKTSETMDVVSVTDEKVELLKDVFWDMNEISSDRKTKSTTVSTETADDDGNIVVEQETKKLKYKYVTVEHKAAMDMAEKYDFTDEQKEMLSELLSDENSGLWSSVMYGIGHSSDEIVKVALTQLGNVGGQPYWSWYGFNSRVAWCACFVSWCANESGYLDTGVIPKFAACVVGVQWFKDHDQWQPRSYVPKAGDIIFFDWEQDGEIDHVGIVESVADGYVHTVEGNTSNTCNRRQYALNSASIYGYGVPAY